MQDSLPPVSQDSLPPVSAQGVSFFALRRGKTLDNREIDDKI